MKKLIEEYYQKMDSVKGDYSQMKEVFNDKMTFHFPGIPTPLTLDQFKETARGIYAGFSDFKHTIEDVIIEDSKVACRVNITGTHNGDFQGIPATNKSIAVGAITMFRIENGRLSEHWICVDMLGIMGQIGALSTNQ